MAPELDQQPTDIISSLRFSPTGQKLIVSSWDKTLYVYTRNTEDQSSAYSLSKRVLHRAVILDCCFGADDNTAYTVGLDWDVRKIDLESGDDESADQTVLSTHDDAASNKVCYSKEHDLVLSTSWNGILHAHIAGRNGVFARIRLAEKPWALAVTAARAVVSMAERKVNVYDLRALKMLAEQAGPQSGDQVDGERETLQVEPWQSRESSLKFMTRDLACMPDGTGFATSSIEGRVGVEWFDAEKEKDTYAFKCHRQMQQDESGQEVDVVYPVNALAFNPTYGTFATGGGDGVIAFWDAQTKRRVRQLPKYDASVAALDISPDGKWLAVGVSPGFEDGKDMEDMDRSLVKVIVRELAEGEMKGKAPKA